MSKFDRIATFVTVFEEGSFAACAAKLKISSAAVSKQVGLLEQELGFELMHRTTRKLSLTDAGAYYFEQAKKILREMAEMDALALEMRQEPFGLLKVLAQPFFAKVNIFPHLSEFLKIYPKITLKLELAERFSDIEREGIDIQIGMSRTVSDNVIQKTIGRTHYVMCASPAYLEAFGIPRHPQELRHHRYINHSERIPVDITKFKDNHEMYLEPYLLLNDTLAMKECALNNIGIVKLHRYIVEDALSSGDLVEICSDYNEPEQPIFACYGPRKHVPPKVRAFLDYFINK